MSDKRLDKLTQFLADSPNDSFLKFAIAKEHEKSNTLEKALKFYLDIYENDPEYIGLYYHLGKLYEQIDEKHLALNAYQQGIELGKKLGDFHAVSELNNARVNLEMEMGNWKFQCRENFNAWNFVLSTQS